MPIDQQVQPDSEHSRRTPQLTLQDADVLARLNRKLQVIRDRVTGVAKAYVTGALITGRGATGKTHTVTETLECLAVSYVLHNTHLTPRGLFDAFALNPSVVHVIEDAEEVIDNRSSLGVLRSATWGSRRNREGRFERLIAWRVHKHAHEVIFDGGVILISNRKLSQMPEAQAFATRIPCVDLPVSEREIAALMRHVALGGYRIGNSVLDPSDCMEVAEYIIGESAQLNCQLDMRMLVNAFADRLQAEDHDAGCTWRDLVASSLRGRPSVTDEVMSTSSRQQRRAAELAIAREIADLTPNERLRAWQDRTNGASRATLYRRMEELARADALVFET